MVVVVFRSGLEEKGEGGGDWGVFISGGGGTYCLIFTKDTGLVFKNLGIEGGQGDWACVV